mmetsp:Transcript_108209/g.304911  ORF Transcript_108209/g.304911 Transcript_108209/m.304911 type:complete len:267 (+) Transcript_108209:187-987(+)
MALPPILIAVCFFVAVVASIAIMAYIAWKGSQPSTFFSDVVKSSYDLQMSQSEIQAYYDLKDKLQRQHAPEAISCEDEIEVSADGEQAVSDRWVMRLPQEDRGNLQKALMKRMVCGIDRLDQVQRDKPGNWKLWREKLVSERYWGSLCDAERLVGEEIDLCIAEADELEPGWRDHIFRQAVQCWRMQKQREVEKKVAKKTVVNEKKQKEKEERAKELEKKKAIEDQERQARAAEKAMEKLIREEEKLAAEAASKVKAKSKPKAKKK